MGERKQPTSNDSDGRNGDQDRPPSKKVATQPANWNDLNQDEILTLQMKGWKSEVYEHFLMPPDIIAKKNGVVSYVFFCKQKPSISISRKREDKSASNLLSHVKSCDPNPTPESNAIKGYAHGRSYSPEALQFLLVKWVTSCSRPFSIVQDKPFIQIIKMLYNKVCIISPHTLSTDVKKVFDISRESVISCFEEHQGLIHISCDGWTSPNVVAFLGVIAHWTRNGKMTHVILDFVRLDRGHTGEYLAKKLLQCLKEYKIDKKILGIACDNASNNNTMLEALQCKEPSFLGKQAQVRCLCHIINLIVKAVLSQFYSTTIVPATVIMKRQGIQDAHPVNRASKEYEADSDGEEEMELASFTQDMENERESDDKFTDELEQQEDAFDNEMVGEINEELENELYTSDTDNHTEISPWEARHPTWKLVTLSKKIFNNAVLHAELAAACNELDIEAKVMIRPVVTQWNSLLPVVSRALNLCAPLESLCKARSNTNVAKFYPSDAEWELLSQLKPLLEIFEEASTTLQMTDTPPLHQSLMLFDYLTTNLESFIADAKLLPAIRAAAKRGTMMVNKYTALCQESLLPRLAIIMHPRFKLQWFSDQSWTGASIDEAKNSLREMWVTRYKDLTKDHPNVQVNRPAPNLAATAPRKSRPSFAEHCMQNLKIMDNELEAYLLSPPDLTIKDPILYWLRQSGDLARMGLDLCGCPATSTDVERAFSGGRLTVSRMRHSLTSESTRAATVLGSWVRIPGLLQESQLLKVFRGRAHQVIDISDD